ncbi:hypothetical protein DN53_14565 [Flagellimonas olearia]|uniref:Uncharacterized protein n=1 Tax=Flagellimonas olearia TaxID=552546 RepID=A0A444VKW3_9FLAO|nr:hypothetical protein DN53_14565 [Allomuricauda olearia]
MKKNRLSVDSIHPINPYFRVSTFKKMLKQGSSTTYWINLPLKTFPWFKEYQIFLESKILRPKSDFHSCITILFIEFTRISSL